MAKTKWDIFEELSKKQQPKDLIVEFWSPDEGDELVGHLVAIEVVQNDKVQEPCNRYVFDTDEGMRSVLMGAASDKQLEGRIEIGKLTYVKYEGKREIDNGAKQVNIWKVIQVEGGEE